MALVRTHNTQQMPVRGWDLANYGNALSEFDRLFNEMAAPFFSQAQQVSGYPADLYETSENLVLEMAVPGIRADDLDISIEGRQLTIRGTLPTIGEGQEQDRRYWLQAIPRGEFSRSVTLPTTVEMERVEARVQDSLLVLTLPKVAETKAHRITVTRE